MTTDFNVDKVDNMTKRIEPNATNNKMANFLVKKGIVKNEDQAFYVLLGVCAVCLLLAGYIFYAYVFGSPKSTIKLTPEQQKARQDFESRLKQVRERAQTGSTTNSQ